MTYFGFEDTERMTCTSLAEFVEQELDFSAGEEDWDEVLEGMAWPMVVVEYKQKVIGSGDIAMLADSALENLLEALDETFGDPEDDYTMQSKVMKNAARAFASSVAMVYHVWTVEECGRHEVSREQALEIMQ